MPADRADDDAPTTLRCWAALLGGLVVAGTGLWFLAIGHTWPLLSAAQLGAGGWMAVEGLRGLLRSRESGADRREGRGDGRG